MKHLVLLLSLFLLLSSTAFAHPGVDERIDILTQRIEANPKDQRSYISRGALYSHEGEFTLALADLSKAEQLGPPIAVAYEQGVLHHRMGKLTEARTYLEGLLKVVPNHAPALERLARLLAEMGEPAAALVAYEELFAAQAQPNPGSYVSAAKLLAEQGETGTERAIEMLDSGIQRLGIIPQLQHYAIELELQSGRKGRALDRLESLKPVLGEGPEWKIEKGELLLQLGRTEEALTILDEASSQLATLRQTPARQALAERITKTQSDIDTPADLPASDKKESNL